MVFADFFNAFLAAMLWAAVFFFFCAAALGVLAAGVSLSRNLRLAQPNSRIIGTLRASEDEEYRPSTFP